nr:uncharacterized protein LOC109148547 isoform X2 [Ipomoea trifida]
MAIKENPPARLPNGDDDEEQFGNGNSSSKFSLQDECDDNCVAVDDDDDDDDEAEAAGNESQSSMVRSLYWESQEALLQEILENYKLSGTKVREGRHEYIEVMVSTQGRKKQVPLVIELNLRDEFKMGKSCEEYCRMVEQLPQVYIGKGEYLNAIVRAVCDAAKKSASEQRIHMGPWRKTNFMLMKWSPAASVEKTTSLGAAHQSSSTQLVIMSPRQWHPSITSGLQPVTGTTVKVA